MPPKGPEKRQVNFRLSLTAYKWLAKEAKGLAVGTYLSRQIEESAAKSKKPTSR